MQQLLITKNMVLTNQKTGRFIYFYNIRSNMLTKKQIEILSHFNLFEEITFKQLKNRSGQKSNNLIQTAIQAFKEENLVTEKKTGNVSTFKLDLNSKTLKYLTLINEYKIREKNLPLQIIKKFEPKKITPFFILLVFGSYAKQTMKKESDLDIALIVDNETVKKKVTPYIRSIERKEIISIDSHVITKEEYTEMITSDYENLGKQIFKNNLVIKGYEEFIELNNG